MESFVTAAANVFMDARKMGFLVDRPIESFEEDIACSVARITLAWRKRKQESMRICVASASPS